MATLRRVAFFQGALAALGATVAGYLAWRAWGWLFWPAVAADFSFALVPGWLQDDAITALGGDAKVLALYLAMLVQTLAGGGLAALWPGARWWVPASGAAALSLGSALLFKLIASPVQLPAAVPFLAGAGLGALGYGLGWAILRAYGAPASGIDPLPSDPSRRGALAALGTLIGAVILWPWVRGDLNRARASAAVDAAPASPELLEAVRGGGLDFDQIPQVSPWHTPEPALYYVSKNLEPHQISLANWRALEVGGLVETPLKLSLDDLQALPAVERHVTLQCIDFDPYSPLTDDLIGNGLWTGAPLARVLERARVLPEAVDLKIEASDGYSDSLPLARALEDDVLLVWALDGQPLSAKHGYPLRLIVPGQYGMKNVKHVRALTAVAEDYKGYWQNRGWVDDAPTQTYAKIETLQFDQLAPLGQPLLVAGWTFAGLRGVSRVEVSLDNGANWVEARLEPQRAPATWVRWVHLWTPEVAGRYGIQARATDGQGTLQAARRVAAFPAGTTGHHRVWIDVAPPPEAPPQA